MDLLGLFKKGPVQKVLEDDGPTRTPSEVITLITLSFQDFYFFFFD